MYFPLKLKISLWGQFFLIVRVKSNTEKWKLNFFIDFFTLPKPSKVLLHNAPMWNRGNKKIQFFQNLHKRLFIHFFRAKEWIKIFTLLFSVMLLTQRIRKSCPQSEIFSLGGQYYGLGQSSVYDYLEKRIFFAHAS